MRNTWIFAAMTLTACSIHAACPKPIDGAIDDAKKMMAARNANGAFSLLTECRHELKTPEHQKLYKASLVAVQQEDKAAKKRQGVSIGMAAQDVLDSAWGRPERINTTHTAHGVRQQWVYGSGNYLYFENGTLRSIQTRH